jgi:hypothetical protein
MLNKNKELFFMTTRCAASITINYFLWIPIRWFLGKLSQFRVVPIEFIFLVYPGTTSDMRLAGPTWAAKRIFGGKVRLAGMILGNGVAGITVGVSNLSEEFRTDADLCKNVVTQLLDLKERWGAKAISVAGEAPKFLRKHDNRARKRPFCAGILGTTFCVLSTVEKVLNHHELDPGNLSLMVVGARGFIGGPVTEALERLGFHRIAKADLSAKDGCMDPSEAKELIGSMDIVVVLTAKGAEFEPYVIGLTSGTIIIDDTHPKIRGKLRDTIISKGCFFYKVAVWRQGTIFFPGLPGYGPVKDVPFSRWPGCAVEGFVTSASGMVETFTSQEEFDREARRLGIIAALTS